MFQSHHTLSSGKTPAAGKQEVLRDGGITNGWICLALADVEPLGLELDTVLGL